MIVRELLTVLGFDLDEANYKKAEKAFQSLVLGATAIVGALAAVKAAITDAAKDAAEYGEKVEHTAERLGLATDEIQELWFAAEHAGLGVEEINIAFQHLARTAYAARKVGGEAAKAFADLGVSLMTAGGQAKTPLQLFEEIADKVNAIQDPIKRDALLMEVFGRSGAALAPLM